MLNKPSRQSSTFDPIYGASNANDGKSSTSSMTANKRNPYWQGDLQGMYNVIKIVVTAHGLGYIYKAYIGVSAHDVSTDSVPYTDVYVCGQWLENREPLRLTFKCNHSEPVRFVRIWIEDTNMRNLGIVEVDVLGQAPELSGMSFEQVESMVLSNPDKILTVDNRLDCSNACFRKHRCTAFSFTNVVSENNCRLATVASMSADSKWTTFSVEGSTWCKN